MQRPESTPSLGNGSPAEPGLDDYASRLLLSGESWLAAEAQLLRIDARQWVQRGVACVILTVIASALLIAAFVIFFGALVPPLAEILGSMVLAGLSVGAGLFLAGAVFLAGAKRNLTRHWPAASTPARVLTGKAQSNGRY